MDSTTIAQKAQRLFIEHGLTHWKFELKKRTGHNMGLTVYKTLTIILNEFYVHNNPDEMVVDTLLHEIAHALTPGQKHGPGWEKIALALGCVPGYKKVRMPPRKYRAVCTCKAIYEQDSKPNGRWAYYCPKCGKELFHERMLGQLTRVKDDIAKNLTEGDTCQ